MTQRRDELGNERAMWRERLARAPLCEIAEEQTQLDCQPPRTREVLFLLDGSTSMGWDYPGRADAEQRFEQLQRQLSTPLGVFRQNTLTQQLDRYYQQLDTPAKPDRIDAARTAAAAIPEGLDPETRLHLLSFATCGAGLTDEGTVTAGEASAFRAMLEGVELRPHTALAEALQQVPGSTDAGRNPDDGINVVILSDGQESCGGDPCQAAAALKSSMPFAHVSVVSLTSLPDTNRCIAEATGGNFFAASDQAQLTFRLRQTTGQLTAQECLALRDSGQAPATGDIP